MSRTWLAVLSACLVGLVVPNAHAQAPLPAPLPPPPAQTAFPPASQAAPTYPMAELERVLSPVALYPDPLLAQVLAAATYPVDIPAAAQWAEQHRYFTGDRLAAEIAASRLPWEPAIQALLPFPSVLGMMASAMPWTEEVGNAFLVQGPDVTVAIQTLRLRARDYGYLRSNGQITVSSGPYVEIQPANPAFVVVPSYDPVVVFASPRPGFVVASGITFGFGVTLGPRFAPWGWGTSRFGWRERVVIVNSAPWRRTWVNRGTYVHPYAVARYPVRRERREERGR